MMMWRVSSSVHIDEPGRHRVIVGVDLLSTMFGDLPDLGDPPVVDRDVAGP